VADSCQCLLAGALMGMSSLAVMANSLTLQFQKPIDVTSGRKQIKSCQPESRDRETGFQDP